MLTSLGRSIGRVFNSKPTLWHLRVQFPLNQRTAHTLLSRIRRARDTDIDALAVSISASGAQDKVQAQLIEDALLSAAEKLRSPIYTFIEDIATTEGYRLATIGNTISATPYSLIGELGVYKTYRNITKLLARLGISIDLHQKGNGPLWSSVTEKRPEEQAFSESYVKSLEGDLIKTVSGRRGIDPKVAQSLHSKLLTAKQALSLKLIDQIRTFDEFRASNCPNHTLKEYLGETGFPLLKLSAFEQSAITNIVQAAQMRNVPAYYLPNNAQLVGQMGAIINMRLNDEEFLSYLDSRLCPQILSFLEEERLFAS